MTPDDAPSLADDEAALLRYAENLVHAVESVVADWFRRLITARAPGVAITDDMSVYLDDGAVQVVSELRALLGLDISSQTMGPLEVLRRAIRFPQYILSETGAEPIQRDSFAVSAFPDDVFGLTPASFADIDPSLHEPGLIWGAAKAHVHLRRRREAAAE